MKEIVKELMEKMSMKKCPICGCDKLWFKMYYETGFGRYNVLIKCDNCAYVNTTVPNIADIGRKIYPEKFSYEDTFVFVHTKGEGKTDKLIGYDYWFSGGEFVERNVKCPACGAKSKLLELRPHIRYEGQYRIDVIRMCENGHNFAFGVHVDKITYNRIKEVVECHV